MVSCFLVLAGFFPWKSYRPLAINAQSWQCFSWHNDCEKEMGERKVAAVLCFNCDPRLTWNPRKRHSFLSMLLVDKCLSLELGPSYLGCWWFKGFGWLLRLLDMALLSFAENVKFPESYTSYLHFLFPVKSWTVQNEPPQNPPWIIKPNVLWKLLEHLALAWGIEHDCTPVTGDWEGISLRAVENLLLFICTLEFLICSHWLEQYGIGYSDACSHGFVFHVMKWNSDVEAQ